MKSMEKDMFGNFATLHKNRNNHILLFRALRYYIYEQSLGPSLRSKSAGNNLANVSLLLCEALRSTNHETFSQRFIITLCACTLYPAIKVL